jgi:hypothetical protein
MSWVVHGVRFVCEIAAVVAFVWWGWPVLGIVLGAIVIVVWGAFVAPKAARRLADPARGALELVIFGAATAAFVSVGQTVLAIVFAAAAAASAGLSRRVPAP